MSTPAHNVLLFLSRFGYVCQGLLYLIVGAVGLSAGFGLYDDPDGRPAAVFRLRELGVIPLTLVIIGLGGYSLWRFVQTFADTEEEGRGFGLIIRACFFFSGALYGGLAYLALESILSEPRGGDDAREAFFSRVLELPAGMWLLGSAGVFLMGVGIFQLYRAYKAAFQQKLTAHDPLRRWLIRAGRLGFLTRGVSYNFLGGILILAARDHNPEEAGGVGVTLEQLLEQPLGNATVVALSLGLLAYGLFSLSLARYRRLNLPI